MTINELTAEEAAYEVGRIDGRDQAERIIVSALIVGGHDAAAKWLSAGLGKKTVATLLEAEEARRIGR